MRWLANVICLIFGHRSRGLGFGSRLRYCYRCERYV